MTIATFMLIKNESEYVWAHVMALLDHVDGMYFYDGNSTDGTLEMLEYIKQKYDKRDKIHIYKDKDCKDLQGDYVRLWNDLIKEVKEDYLFFCHPDMIVTNPEQIKVALESKAIRYYVNMESIAGENRDLRIVSGRGGKWSTIYRNGYGIHYYGYYGTMEEDCYFSAYTGDSHRFYNKIKYLPYDIVDSGVNIVHYCDTKPYERRYGRMLSCLKNLLPHNGLEHLEELAKGHPRVTLQNGNGFKFEKNGPLPEVFAKYKDEFYPLRRS